MTQSKNATIQPKCDCKRKSIEYPSDFLRFQPQILQKGIYNRVAGVQRDVDNAAFGEPNSDQMHTARRQVDFRPVGVNPERI